MASSSASSTKLSLKLLIDQENERVLFAEASKNFIDFLFNLLRLPIGTVASLLTKNDMLGCIGKLCESVENLSDDYWLNPIRDKDALLKPNTWLYSGNLLLPATNHGNYTGGSASAQYSSSSASFGSSSLFSFGSSSAPSGSSFSFCSSSAPSSSSSGYNTKATAKKTCGEGGFVKEVVTYTVMDDLEVRPMSTISTITLLSKFNIKDITSLQERIVELDMEQGIKLLKASLECKNVLTSVFLKGV
ncbi:uncharacterized protein LOC129292284 [Prosopis cineraria]|uniref:uncharacterized protein LOC129292284 n=1 Tax=Prosopis cineraria TaxID=364024 RepID=UPI002410301B|nr:uncharacterized protein LOC129292284 [Prosopis cineraria]XP_054785837.1 uncharacterized protein LOC129292284 [Prosopis cineraria]XP_054785838.1 uncharacterized protein LOC129292284 [Prosopis cineraria]XP_054785839.1 uncharacterized protein LOC129292284 [Prosopis cineraria]XP_054785840.1 uncharacterized protein LOC129292284 [Prosopis cineraria]